MNCFVKTFQLFYFDSVLPARWCFLPPVYTCLNGVALAQHSEATLTPRVIQMFECVCVRGEWDHYSLSRKKTALCTPSTWVSVILVEFESTHTKERFFVAGGLVGWPSQGLPPSCAQHCCASQHLPYQWPCHPEVRCHCDCWWWGQPWVEMGTSSVPSVGRVPRSLTSGRARGGIYKSWLQAEPTTWHMRKPQDMGCSTAARLHTHPHTARNDDDCFLSL